MSAETRTFFVMPLTRKKKEEVVAKLREVAKDASAIVFADFSGLKTKEMNELRKTVKQLGGRVEVIKKTLAQRGLKEVLPEGILTRPGGIATIWFKAEDAISLLKAVWQFSKRTEAFKILGGYAPAFGGLMDTERVLMVAKLPSREMLLGQLVGVLNWPLVGLLRVLEAASKRSNQ
jgi:large subunit ribosomal protein L10